MSQELSPSEIEKITRDFRRCGPETIEQIIGFRRDRAPTRVPPIVIGIVLRYLPEADRPKLMEAAPESRLDVLGIDSLTLLEITFDIQDALELILEDSELRQMRTIADVHRLLIAKVSSPSESSTHAPDAGR